MCSAPVGGGRTRDLRRRSGSRADRRACFHSRGRPAHRRARIERRSGAASRSRSSTRARGCGGRRATPRRTSRPSARRWASPSRAVIDPRRLPDQLRDQGPGAAQEVADLAHPRAADRRRDRRGGRRPPPRAQKGEPHGPSMKRAAKVIAEALAQTDGCRCCSSRPPGTRASSAATSTRRRADRAGGRRPAPRPLPRLLPPLRAGLRHHRRRAPGRRPRRGRREGRPRAPASGPRQRRGGAAGLLPGPPRQRRQGRDGAPRAWRRSSPSRASRASRDPRDAGPGQAGPDRKEVAAAKRLRKHGPQATKGGRRCSTTWGSR